MASKVVFENSRPELYIDGQKRIPLIFTLSDFPVREATPPMRNAI